MNNDSNPAPVGQPGPYEKQKKVLRIKWLDNITIYQVFFVVILILLSLGYLVIWLNSEDLIYQEEEISRRELDIYVPERFELMSPMNRRSLKTFGLGAGLFISTTVAGTAGYVAKVTCGGGVLASVFGPLTGVGVCIASAAVFLISGAIAAGLTANGVEGVGNAARDETHGRYSHQKILGADVLHDTIGTPAEQHLSFAAFDFDGLQVGISNITVYDSIISNQTIHTVSYSFGNITYLGLMFDGSIDNYFNDMLQTESTAVDKRDTNENKATFAVGSKYSQTEAQEEGNAREDKKAGDRVDALSKYFDNKPRTSYCLQMSNGKETFMKGEFHTTGGKGMNKQCLKDIWRI